MKCCLAILCAAAMVPTGCVSPDRKAPPVQASRETTPTKGELLPREATPADPYVVDQVSGQIVKVDQELEFVVVAFSLKKMPNRGDRLAVVRDGVKVGEVEVDAFARSYYMTADIIGGTARQGDLIVELPEAPIRQR